MKIYFKSKWSQTLPFLTEIQTLIQSGACKGAGVQDTGIV